MSALDLSYDELLDFDVIHASPPCQKYSTGSAVARKRGKTYPDLVEPTRLMLIASGKPYIMENVRPAPLHPDICLDGSMFGLSVKRPRVFETNIEGIPVRPRDTSNQGTALDGDIVTVAGSGGGGMSRKVYWGLAMGIDWMNKNELREAIPPAYTHWIGVQVLRLGEALNLRDRRYKDRISESLSEHELSSAPVQMRLI
jgi:DNA (cytosine-5)-methyltransferase 1